MVRSAKQQPIGNYAVSYVLALAIACLVMGVTKSAAYGAVSAGESSVQQVAYESAARSGMTKQADYVNRGRRIAMAYAAILDRAPTLKPFTRIKSSGADECTYALIEMSGDEVPELVIQGKFTGGGYKALVYTYSDKKEKAGRVKGSLSYDDVLRQGEAEYGAGMYGYGLVVPHYNEYFFTTVENGRLKSVTTSSNQPLRPVVFHELNDRGYIRALKDL